MILNGTHGRKILVSAGAVRRVRGCAYQGIRYTAFEHCVLGLMEELTAADVLGKPGAAQDRRDAASGRLNRINTNIEAVRAKAAKNTDVTVFLDLLADMHLERQAAIAEFEEAEAEAARQEDCDVGDFTSSVNLLRDAEARAAAGDADVIAELDALRGKVRAALRRLVSEMRLLIVPHGKARIMPLQVWFRSGRQRLYLIRSAGDACEGQSIATTGPFKGVDLRQPEAVKKLTDDMAATDWHSAPADANF